MFKALAVSRVAIHWPLLSLSLLAACANSPESAPSAESRSLVERPSAELRAAEWPTYRGGWFEIDYPAEYDVRPSLPSSSAAGYDSVFFEAPDRSVSLYVCSPQWSREPSDILVDTETETLMDSERREIADGLVRRYVIAARDGSYERLYEETELYDGTIRWVVGLRYPDAAARDQVWPLYKRFTGSLQQLAD